MTAREKNLPSHMIQFGQWSAQQLPKLRSAAELVRGVRVKEDSAKRFETLAEQNGGFLKSRI